MPEPASAVLSATSEAYVVAPTRYPVTVMMPATEMLSDIVTLSVPFPMLFTGKNSVSLALGDAGPTVAAEAMTSRPATKPTVTSTEADTVAYALLFASVKLTVATL